jgi:hypothetical protein
LPTVSPSRGPSGRLYSHRCGGLTVPHTHVDGVGRRKIPSWDKIYALGSLYRYISTQTFM